MLPLFIKLIKLLVLPDEDNKEEEAADDDKEDVEVDAELAMF